MKTQLKSAVAFIALFFCAGVSAQSLQEAIRLTDNEQYVKAKVMFQQLVAKEPTNGDNFFYFGDLMLKMEDLDSARILFKKGVDINPMNPLTHVGMGRYLLYTGQNEEGQKEMAQAKALIATQAGKKDMNMSPQRQAAILLEIAETYTWAAQPNYNDAIEFTNQAEKLDKASAEVFLVRGDAMFQKDPVNATNAIAAFNQAAKVDPKSVKAYVRIAKVYANGKNMPSAVSFYNKALSIDPNFAPAYSGRGEAQYQMGKFDSAALSYKKYLELNDDCYSRYRYAAQLYKSGDFDGAIKEGMATLACDSSITVVYRIVARSYVEKKTPEPANAIRYYELFFLKQKKYGKPAILADDFVGLGKAYSKNKQDSLAILEYQRAAAFDTTRKDIYFDIATAYFIMKKYDQAALNYRKKIDANPANATISDWNAYGRALFLQKDFVHADSAFRQVTLLDPPNPIGWLWRGRSTAELDKAAKITGDSARYFYETYYDLAIKDKEKNKKDLVIAAKYLGAYHLIKKNYPCSKAWFQFALELDPNAADVKAQLEEKELKPVTAATDLGTCKMPPKGQ